MTHSIVEIFRVLCVFVIAPITVTGNCYQRCLRSCCGEDSLCGQAMRLRTLIVLIVMLTVCCDSVNTAKLKRDRRTCRFGTVIPRDPLVLSGQNLTLICNGQGKGEMWFERGINAERLPEKYVTKLNKTAIQLDIPISEEDVKNSANSVQYKCMMEKRSGEKKCVDNIYVEMDYYPIEPKNLDCRVFDFDTMNCTWDLGIKYKHEEHMNITCLYANLSYDRVDTTLLYISDFGASFAMCPNQGTNWCYWNESDFTDPFRLIVRVVVLNKKNNITVETNLTRHKLDIVEPAGVKDLRVVNTSNPRQVVLKWEPTKVFQNYVFSVTITSDCSEKMECKVYYDGHSRGITDPATCNITLYDLNPYTVYTFSVKGRIMTTKAFDNKTLVEMGYWSETKEIHFHADSDKVDKNPVTGLGLYELTSVYVQDGQKLLNIYFTPLPVCDLHTDPKYVEYTIQYQNRSNTTNTTVTHPSFSAEVRVPDLKVLNVTLWARNNIGSNVDPQLLMLNTFGPAPSELIVEYNKTGESCTTFASLVVQDNGSQHTDINHTVVWCKGNQISCSEPLQWKELNSDITQFTFPGKQCDEYRYGLVTHGYHKGQGQTGSTGIHWETCIYLHGKVPDKPLENVEMVQNPTTRGFTVSWQKYDCKDTKAYIAYYTVKYCKADNECKCQEDETLVNVSGRLNSFSASDLQAGSRFCAWVAGFSKSGIGPYNDKLAMQSVTEIKDSIDGKLLGSIVAGIVGGIIVIAVVVLFTRRIYQKIQRMQQNGISIPSDPGQNHIVSAATPLVVDTDKTYNYLGTSGIGTSPIHTQFTTETELPSNSESASLLHSDRLEKNGGFHSPNDKQRFCGSANDLSTNCYDSEDSDVASELTGYNKPKNIDINVVDDSGSPKYNYKPKNINTNVAADSGSTKHDHKLKNIDINFAADSGSPKRKETKMLCENVAEDSGNPKNDLESYSKAALSGNAETDVSVSDEHSENSFTQNKLNKEAVELNDTDIIKDTDNSVIPLNFIHEEIDGDNTSNMFASRKTEKESVIENMDTVSILKSSGGDNNLFSKSCNQDNMIFKSGQKNVSMKGQEMELLTFHSTVINDECAIFPESQDVELENETAFDSPFSNDNQLATGYRGINDGDEFEDSSDGSDSERESESERKDGSDSESKSKTETSSHDLVPDCNRDSTNASELCPESGNHNSDRSIQSDDDDKQVEKELENNSSTTLMDGYKNELKVYSSVPTKLEQDGGYKTKANGLTIVDDGRKGESYKPKANGLTNVDKRCKEENNKGKSNGLTHLIHSDFGTLNDDDRKENFERGSNLSDIDGSVESVSDHSDDPLPLEHLLDSDQKRNSNDVGFSTSDESRTNSLDGEPVNYLAAHLSSDTEKTDPVFKPIVNMVVDRNPKTPTKHTNGHCKNQTLTDANGISHLSNSHS